MVPDIEVRAQRAVLVAGYQPAALLTSCVVCHVSDKINQRSSHFSASIHKLDPFWFERPSHLILDMAKAYWRWSILNTELTADHVSGTIKGDPEVMLWLSPTITQFIGNI